LILLLSYLLTPQSYNGYPLYDCGVNKYDNNNNNNSAFENHNYYYYYYIHDAGDMLVMWGLCNWGKILYEISKF